MKKFVLLLISVGLLVFACTKEKKSERFRLLTGHVWTTDTLLANGVDASDPGELLEPFKGDAKFEEDGTGSFGKYKGAWQLHTNDTELTINTDSLPVPIICDIVELTTISLKITTVVPNLKNPLEPYDIRMTFKAK